MVANRSVVSLPAENAGRPVGRVGHHGRMNDAIRRVWSQLPHASRRALTEDLSPADLRSLLLDVSRVRAARVTPAGLMRQRRDDRFVQPSTADPRRLSRVQTALWDALPARFAGVELSPVAPLGTCSVVAPIPQNNVLSTVRGTEVAADPTNNLALEAAVRRRVGTARVDLATCQRVVRAQAFEEPGRFAHFQLFALVSSTRDRGSGRAEAEVLIDHLSFWRSVLEGFGLTPRLTFTTFRPGAVRDRILDTVQPAVGVTEDAGRTRGAAYYDGTAIAIGTDAAELGDGGVTRWTAHLLGDAKERCVTSCISTERLAALV
jgi:hypothetical protein